MLFVPSALYLATVIKKAVNRDALFPMVERYVVSFLFSKNVVQNHRLKAVIALSSYFT